MQRLVLRTRCAFLVFVLVSAASNSVVGQGPSPKYDLSVIASAVRFVDFNPVLEELRRESTHAALHKWTEPGFGFRFTDRLSSQLSIEAEFLVFPEYAGGEPPDAYYRGWGKLGLFAGPSAGWQLGQTRIGGNLLPGFVRFGRLPAIVFRSPGPNPVAEAVIDNYSAIEPALILAGHVEVSMPKRVIFRIDAGDLAIWYSPEPHDLNPVFVRNNLEVSLALGIRF